MFYSRLLYENVMKIPPSKNRTCRLVLLSSEFYHQNCIRYEALILILFIVMIFLFVDWICCLNIISTTVFLGTGITTCNADIWIINESQC